MDIATKSDLASISAEKSKVALGSVLAAIFLTGTKLGVGLWTGSLGILSEAIHSGLDLTAALVTYLAVRFSGKPADRDHTYGHGKIENLSALFETLLLIGACIWIVCEAIDRLLHNEIKVQASWWAFAVMFVSIIVDVTRSRALYHVAKKHSSQALEADALHFSTDVWSSCVVILGLISVKVSEWTGYGFLMKADAISALAVAAIVIWIGAKLGFRSVNVLSDGISSNTTDEVYSKIQELDGVEKIERLRLRQSGPDSFADLTLNVGRETTLEKAHDIATKAEAAVRTVLPGADVVVQVNPIELPQEDVLTKIKLCASRHGHGAHGVRIYNLDGKQTLELHLEVDESISLEDAHSVADNFEKEVLKLLPGLDNVVTHIEPVRKHDTNCKADLDDEEKVKAAINSLPGKLGLDIKSHAITMRNDNGKISLSFHCLLSGKLSITEAHDITEKIENVLRSRVPKLGRVLIHVEPDEDHENAD